MPAPPLSPDETLARLRAALGPQVVTGPEEIGERYLVDWSGDHRGRALALARPRSTEEVRALVLAAAEAGVPLVPQGGHTGLVGSASPSPAGREVVVSLERMSRVRRIDLLGGSVVVEAGAILQSLKAEVAAAGGFFPLSLGAEGSCRIGGNVGTNAGGINVVRYGMTRDLVLGLEVVLADGTVLSDLRGLSKNNTGYDWKQLFIGAEGTLGIVTAACLKLFPKPTQVETLWLAVPSPEALMALYGELRRRAGDFLSAFELIEGQAVAYAAAATGVRDPLAGRHGTYALVELSAAGGPPLRPWLVEELARLMEEGVVADGALAESLDQARAFWGIREAIVEAQAASGRHLRTDVSVPIEAIAAFLADAHATVERVAPDGIALAYGHVGDGNIHFNAVRRPETAEAAFAARIKTIEAAINEAVDRHGGSISAEHGIGVSRREAFAIRQPPAERALFERLRAMLDPEGLFAPGRIFAAADADEPAGGSG